MNRSRIRRKRCLAALALLLALTLTACGGSPAGNSYAPTASPASAFESPQTATMSEEAGISLADDVDRDGGMDDVPALTDRKVIKHGDLSLETMRFDEALVEIVNLVNAAGGYVESQNTSGVSLREKGRYNERYATILARVPADRLDEVTASVGGLCNVVQKSESMEDITDSYFDTQARLDTLVIQEERLLLILEKAEKLEEIITLEQALSETRYQIEALTAAIKRMDSQVAYSYLNINLSEVVEYQPVTAPPKTFGQRLSASFSVSRDQLFNTLEKLLFFLIEDGPVLLIYLAILLLILRVFRRISRWLNASRPPRPAKSPRKWTSPFIKSKPVAAEPPPAQPGAPDQNDQDQ